MDYQTVKLIHIGAAYLTIAGFIARAMLSIYQSTILANKAVKILPHVVDTILILSGVSLIITTGFYPIRFSWMTVKLILVVAYIASGFYVMKFAKTRGQKILGIFLCLAIIGYILAIAKYKTAFLPFLN